MNGCRFLVTGAQGFIGSWVVKNLIEAGEAVVALDLADQPERFTGLLPAHDLAAARFVRADVNDLRLLDRLIGDEGITHVVHLAGLQTPECRARPLEAAAVNVTGTLTVFEAVKAHGKQVMCLVYASSGAVLGSDERYDVHPIGDDAVRTPDTLYGVFKAANEDCARLYWQEHGIRSVGLRPPVVYGLGRDRGLTAGTTQAIRAALRGEPYEIGFTGLANVEYVEDVAKCFVACARQAPAGAPRFNMRGEVLSVQQMITAIGEVFPAAQGKISCSGPSNRMANDVSDAGLQELIGPFRPRSYREGVEATARLLRAHGAPLPLDQSRERG